MSIVRRSSDWPFSIMKSFFEDFWDPFDFTILSFPRMTFPRMDIKEEEKEYIITAEVPGFKKDDINIEIRNDVMTISSEHKEEKEEKKEGYIYKERSHRAFSRSFRIPEGVTAEEVSAKLEDGILTIHIPKKEPEKPKKIEIKD